jgi:hypothetical protein
MRGKTLGPSEKKFQPEFENQSAPRATRTYAHLNAPSKFSRDKCFKP